MAGITENSLSSLLFQAQGKKKRAMNSHHPVRMHPGGWPVAGPAEDSGMRAVETGGLPLQDPDGTGFNISILFFHIYPVTCIPGEVL